ncbi:hypothetical protein OIU84_010704 [Salix udensis]|uniref:beta-galactosidase n=1 Tax=Salix udensis TaxID=889485 RepID=A0AAD6NW65_9ROSI|nr:hypothetical protein OIU84_010704 [Salix udensis]
MGNVFLLLQLLFFFSSWLSSVTASVSYDHKAVIINGQRRILISGSIHYPRSTPEMWPGLIQKAKDGGVDVIQTYVFWNGHEPTPGNYYFEDRYDLVKFIKLVQQAGLYLHLRIGPYVCAEWNFGGFPVWLKYVPGIEFRTDNVPFKVENLEPTRNLSLRFRGPLFSPNLFEFGTQIDAMGFKMCSFLIFYNFNEGGNAKVHREDCGHDEVRKVI